MIVLRVIAFAVAAAGIVGPAMYLFGRDADPPQGEIFLSAYGSDRYTVGSFLAQIATPLGWAGLLFALSCLVSVYAARLDLEIVLADAEEEPTD